MLVAWDTLEVPTFRHEEFPAYQSGRKFDDALLEQLVLPEFVAACGFQNAKAPGFEADDFLAAAAAAEEKRGGTVLSARGAWFFRGRLVQPWQNARFTSRAEVVTRLGVGFPCPLPPKGTEEAPFPRPGFLIVALHKVLDLRCAVQINPSHQPHRIPPVFERTQEMLEPLQKASEDFQKIGKDNYDAMVRTYSEVNKGLQAIGARVTDYSKRAFEDASRAFEQLVGAKSLESVVEIQSQYAKKAYDTWVAEASKLGEMYAAVARDAYKPVEKAVAKRAS